MVELARVSVERCQNAQEWGWVRGGTGIATMEIASKQRQAGEEVLGGKPGGGVPCQRSASVILTFHLQVPSD